MYRYVIVALLFMPILVDGQATLPAGWWMNQPYGDESFNYLVEYTHNVTLECNDTRKDDTYTFQYWFRPDLTIMRSGDTEQFDTLDGVAGWLVNTTTDSMQVFTVQDAHFGFYHCVLNNTEGDMLIIKKAINWEEPYYGDTWEKYKKNTFIGGVAAGGFLVVAIALLLICRFKYDPDNDESYSLKDISLEDLGEGTSSSRSGSPSTDHKAIPMDGPQVYVNTAYEGLKPTNSPNLVSNTGSYEAIHKKSPAESPVMPARHASAESLEMVPSKASTESPVLPTRKLSKDSSVVATKQSPVSNRSPISKQTSRSDSPVLVERKFSGVDEAMDTIEKAVDAIEKAVDVIETHPPEADRQDSSDREDVASVKSAASSQSGRSLSSRSINEQATAL